ncbi:MAG: nucleotide sugar dehydrogenase [Actinobacteria bacterium]|nr:nucleotide sugar dehydrogenase [Actinomycetota bacterium]
MRITVVGTGHVGLVSCVTFAHMGHDVVGIDADRAKVESLRAGRSPFFEPGVQGLLDEGIANGRLRFTTDYAEGIPGADVAFICVGTPPRESGEASLVAVEKATRDIAGLVDGPIVIVEKSTVPAGTHDRVKRTIAHERPELADRIRVASNPEFLREGRAVVDTLEPERILVGADDDAAFEALRRIYQPLTAKGVPLIETDIATAEIAKHACNAFLSMKISFINAVARMCERAGADIASVAEVMGTDSRIGASFLNAGIGYGGFCFPKDVDAFERVADSLGYSFPLLREIARINDEAVEAAFLKVRDALWNLDDKRVCLLGLAFKPDTDDVRFAPALALAERLIGAGARVSAYDPAAIDEARREEPEIEYAKDPYGAAADAHVVVLCTEWPEFEDLDLDKLKSVMRYPIFVDGRNVFDPEDMRRRGFTYYSMGRTDPAARRA